MACNNSKTDGKPTHNENDLKILEYEKWVAKMDKIKKELNFEFAGKCPCPPCSAEYGLHDFPDIDKLINSSGNEIPNMWCTNLIHYQKNYFPCCCRHDCKTVNLIKEVGECECPRCCVCMLTTVRCENCKLKDRYFFPCSHWNYIPHFPCDFNQYPFDFHFDSQDILIPTKTFSNPFSDRDMDTS